MLVSLNPGSSIRIQPSPTASMTPDPRCHGAEEADASANIRSTNNEWVQGTIGMQLRRPPRCQPLYDLETNLGSKLGSIQRNHADLRTPEPAIRWPRSATRDLSPEKGGGEQTRGNQGRLEGRSLRRSAISCRSRSPGLAIPQVRVTLLGTGRDGMLVLNSTFGVAG